MKAAIFVLAVMLPPTFAKGATDQGSVNNSQTVAPAVAPTAGVSAASVTTPASAANKKWSALGLIEISSTLQEGAERSQGQGMSQSGLYQIDVGYKLPKDLKLTGRVGYTHEYSYIKTDDGRAGAVRDSRLSLGKAWKEIAKDTNAGATLRWNIPTSRDSQLRQFKSGLAVEGHIDYTWKKLTLEFDPRFTQNFHSIEVADDGVLNNQFSVLMMFNATWAFTEKLSTSVSYWPMRSYTYQGTFRERYTFSYQVGYQVTERFGAALGLSNVQLTTKDNGDSNFTLYDPYEMTAFLDLTVAL
ncbi:MAG: hypothetical protein IT289_03855 [Oligoflexia bacterium]|nr:hypothetical protein [Oligoflexia bacterium]